MFLFKKKKRRDVWINAKVTLSVSLQHPNKIYGKIQIEPSNLIDSIHHFELFVNDVALKANIAPTDTQFSAEGFAGGEQYEVYIAAHAKDITDVEPIESNRRVIF